MAQVDINPKRLGYQQFLKQQNLQCASARKFSNHVKELYKSGYLGGDGHGRLSDAEAIVADLKNDNKHANSVCLGGKIVETKTTVNGHC